MTRAFAMARERGLEFPAISALRHARQEGADAVLVEGQAGER
jgi:hypothetical protein